MDLLPAHQPFFEGDTDEELSDEQIRELLSDAAQRMRAKAAPPVILTEAPFKLPRLRPGHIADTYESTDGNITRLDHSKLIDKNQQALANSIKKIDDPLQVRKLKKQEEKRATAGAQWFNMPKTELTPELRRDLQLLKMRNVLDPKRHYKKDNSRNDVPAFSQVGTIIEGATEFYSSRLNKKDRKQTILEEIVTQEQDSGRFQRKYNDISKTKSSGKKSFHKAMKMKRSKGKVVKP
ncbi:rRNA-processing protein FCF2 [Pyrenochaeta sp. MPI-SDFR-AT-0127]|nr:rRNA-processing protein FCF2 [Pyrenochaeta sp. MPI-SDFR-AT-0127]